MKTIEIFKTNFKKILILSCMVVLPVYLIQVFLIVPRLPDKIDMLSPQFVWYLLSTILISIFLYVYYIAVIKLSYETMDGKNMSISEVMNFSVRLWPKILLTALLYGLSVACGFMLFFIPGILLFVAYTFYQYTCVRTGLWGRKSLFLSSLYTKKNMGKAAAIAIIPAILQFVLTTGITSITDSISKTSLQSAVTVILNVAIEFLFSIVYIYIARYIFTTPIDFDINILKAKKNTENAEH